MDRETRRLADRYRAHHADGRACPESRSLARLAEGRAWPWQRRRLTDHLAGCAHCAGEYRTLLAARDGLRDALGVTPRGDGGPGWLSGLAPAGAAAFAIAAVCAVLVFHEGPGTRPDPSPATDTIFASSFGPDRAPVDPEGAAHRDPAGDVLFRSDFDRASES